MQAFTSIDGVDFSICEPHPFNSQWYSHKFKGPGLRYEIAVCINEPNIVWFNGPFPCGAYPDLLIFRSNLKNRLYLFEKCVSDNGYSDQKCVRAVHCSEDQQKVHKNLRARHETVNRRLKAFSCLRNRFRHALEKHYLVFGAVVKFVQIDIMWESPLFSF